MDEAVITFTLRIVTHSSSDWQKNRFGKWERREVGQTRGLNRNRNPTLKAAFKGAAVHVIGCWPEHPLSRGYQRMLEHTKPNLARLTLATRASYRVGRAPRVLRRLSARCVLLRESRLHAPGRDAASPHVSLARRRRRRRKRRNTLRLVPPLRRSRGSNWCRTAGVANTLAHWPKRNAANRGSNEGFCLRGVRNRAPFRSFRLFIT